jgi:hypothetical protein
MELSVMTVLVPTDSAGCVPICSVMLPLKCGFSGNATDSTEMIGRPISRAHVFLNRFRKLGFIEYRGAAEVHRSLLHVILHE